MNEVEDDPWVREFNVSNPQKTYAGYTVYRVSSKVDSKICISYFLKYYLVL